MCRAVERLRPTTIHVDYRYTSRCITVPRIARISNKVFFSAEKEVHQTRVYGGRAPGSIIPCAITCMSALLTALDGPDVNIKKN